MFFVYLFTVVFEKEKETRNRFFWHPFHVKSIVLELYSKFLLHFLSQNFLFIASFYGRILRFFDNFSYDSPLKRLLAPLNFRSLIFLFIFFVNVSLVFVLKIIFTLIFTLIFFIWLWTLKFRLFENFMILRCLTFVFFWLIDRVSKFFAEVSLFLGD